MQTDILQKTKTANQKSIHQYDISNFISGCQESYDSQARLMVLSLQMERKSGFPFAISITQKDPKTGLPREMTKLTQRVSSMTLKEPVRKRHHLNPYPTWAQVKNMTLQVEQTLKNNIIKDKEKIKQSLNYDVFFSSQICIYKYVHVG